MSQQLTRLLFASLVLILAVVVSFAQNNLTAKANNLQPAPSAAEETDRVRDGLIGAVRRVRTEVVKLMTVSGKVVEDSKRIVVLERPPWPRGRAGGRDVERCLPRSNGLICHFRRGHANIPSGCIGQVLSCLTTAL